MKKRSVRIFSWVALGLTVFVVSYLFSVEYSFSTASTVDYVNINTSGSITWPEASPENDTAFGGLFMSNISISDSLPHYRYQQKADSIKAIQNELDIQNRSFVTGSTIGSMGYGFITDHGKIQNSQFNSIVRSLNEAVYKLSKEEKDTAKRRLREEELRKETELKLRTIDHPAETKESTSYYLSLPGYILDYENKFFVANGRYYITTIDSIVTRKPDGGSLKEKTYGRKQIPVRYSAELKQILVPIAKETYTIIMIAFNVIRILVVLLWVYSLLGLPIQLLINISRGKAFTQKNITMLRFIAITVSCLTIINILAPYLVRILMHNYIPSEFHREGFLNVFFSNFIFLLMSAVMFALAVAFKNGYRLQQEQELTV